MDITKTIRYIKRKGFTHIKIELEAHLNRHSEDSERCEGCGGDGYYECRESHVCRNCDGDSTVTCSICDGNGRTETDSVVTECENCDTNGVTACDECDDGYQDCDCDTGCEDCDGSGTIETEGGNMNDHYCQSYVISRVSKRARENLTYCRFYNDGSVDSEFSFTIPIEYMDTIPEFIRAFRELGEQSRHFDTSNAGMHLSVMTEGTYPCTKALDDDKIQNFRQQLKKLLPALYFLASSDHTARPLQYRQPQIDTGKPSAVRIGRGVLEYRVFQTCYDKPDMVLQHFKVIAKTLKFYGSAQIKTELFKQFRFYDTRDNKKAYLNRFYPTTEAITALDKGLSYLKPDELTIAQLKAQRRFTNNAASIVQRQLLKSYMEYRERLLNRNRIWIRSSMNDMFVQNRTTRRLYELKIKPDELKALYTEIRERIEEKPLSLAQWKQQIYQAPSANTVTL